MLDCVRRGYPTQETMSVLNQRVIQVSVSEKFSELQLSLARHLFAYFQRERPVMI